MSSPQIDGILTGNAPNGELNWDVFMNPNLQFTGWLLQPSVISRFNGAQPGAPATRDAYIILAGATGTVFGVAGNANKLARWNGTTWDLQTPLNGWTVMVGNEISFYVFNGTSWILVVPGYLKQTASASLAALSTVASAVYVNLLNKVITITAGSVVLVTINLSGRQTIGAIAAALAARIRVDGAVGDATMAGQGVAFTGALSGSMSVALTARISGLTAGARTINLDWANLGTGTITCDPAGASNTDSARITLEESAV